MSDDMEGLRKRVYECEGWICRVAGVACFTKQLGAYVVSPEAVLADWPTAEWRGDPATGLGRAALKSRKGADMSEWPADLRVREFPS